MAGGGAPKGRLQALAIALTAIRLRAIQMALSGGGEDPGGGDAGLNRVRYHTGYCSALSRRVLTIGLHHAEAPYYRP